VSIRPWAHSVAVVDLRAVVTKEKPGWTWERSLLSGEPATALVEAIQDFHPDLVVMTTAGHHGFMDALRGSTTERVLRAIRCPLLAVSVTARLPHLVRSCPTATVNVRSRPSPGPAPGAQPARGDRQLAQ
jgi:hypothetical protein